VNILFLTLLDIRSVDNHDIYTDLIREFARNNHNIYIVSPIERRYGQTTHLIEDKADELHQRVHILKIKTGNIQKTNIIEKGISTVLLEYQILRAIKRYFSNVQFELVLYSTPPITTIKPIKYIKKRDSAKSYLMLKDIFPQNAVDIGIMNKGLLYKYFRRKEKKLYKVSDKIGCMSQANVDYILRHNPEIEPIKVEICPNSIEIQDMTITNEERISIRLKYGLPIDKIIFIYGGNLGKPQDISFIIECLKALQKNDLAYFLIVGDGTEYEKLHKFIMDDKPNNVKLIKWLIKEDYDKIVAASDIGLIFLDHRFTIPNFPSRLLSYMQAGLPVLAATDPNTDIGKAIIEGEFGWWCISNDINSFVKKVDEALKSDLISIGNKSKQNLCKYSVDKQYEIIINSISESI